MNLRTCVSPSGEFVYGIHTPRFHVSNRRENDSFSTLGAFSDGTLLENRLNFPDGDIHVDPGDTVYEIPNPFPFKGTTYIADSWARAKAENPSTISLARPPQVSLTQWMETLFPGHSAPERIFQSLPEPMLSALAATSTDSRDLVRLAEICCRFIYDPETREPKGLVHVRDEKGNPRPEISRYSLFKTVANNPFLPDTYKRIMVLRPGAQGGSEIVGEWRTGTHVYEYFRRNSYIPWGHYAANMAEDAVRYHVRDLTVQDMKGLRHLYYQRTFLRLAALLNIETSSEKKALSPSELEILREKILKKISSSSAEQIPFNRTLWGWNFGFDFTPTGYRLHGSHQQIHQQFAMLPAETTSNKDGFSFAPFGCGDMIAEFVQAYRERHRLPFFDTYISAIHSNRRVDGNPEKEKSLIVHEENGVILFVPKAQTSQWELQLMTTKKTGNILEADSGTRDAIDRIILLAVKTLSELGAKMITSIEYPKRFDSKDDDQRLLYAFLPKMPESPGGFSEAQLRWINGHFPEDFAAACRSRAKKIAGSF